MDFWKKKNYQWVIPNEFPLWLELNRIGTPFPFFGIKKRVEKVHNEEDFFIALPKEYEVDTDDGPSPLDELITGETNTYHRARAQSNFTYHDLHSPSKAKFS